MLAGLLRRFVEGLVEGVSVSSTVSASVSSDASASVWGASSVASSVGVLPEPWSWPAGLSSPSSACVSASLFTASSAISSAVSSSVFSAEAVSSSACCGSGLVDLCCGGWVSAFSSDSCWLSASS